jgi:hypothetical protein
MRGDPGTPGKPVADDPDLLLTAYVDGVAEVAPGDRRRLEARIADDPRARAEAASVRGVLDRLRAIPAEGNEPDWGALERSIRDAVGERAPRPWWRRGRWLAPAATLAAAATVLWLMWRPSDEVAQLWVQDDERTAYTPAVAVADERPGDDLVRLWLDGAAVDVDPVLGALLIDVDDDASGDEVGLLPAVDLAWVDGLDDASIDRAERWLAREQG